MSADPLPSPTRRLRLRRFNRADLPAFLAYRSDPALGRFQGWEPASPACSAAWLQQMQVLPFCPPGVWFQLAVATRDRDQLIGELGLRVHAKRPQQAELSYTLASAWQGRGLATEAAQAAVNLLFENTSVRRVLALADVRNAPSLRLLQRLGMTAQRQCRVTFRGELCLQTLMAITRG